MSLFNFNLVLGTQTPGAEFKLLWLAVDQNGGRVDIGVETAVGVLLGVADVFAKHRTFTT
jgi:hypothetical protein